MSYGTSSRKSIRHRWMVNSIAMVVIIVVVAVSAFVISVANYYHSTMRNTLTGSVENLASGSPNMKPPLPTSITPAV